MFQRQFKAFAATIAICVLPAIAHADASRNDSENADVAVQALPLPMWAEPHGSGTSELLEFDVSSRSIHIFPAAPLLRGAGIDHTESVGPVEWPDVTIGDSQLGLERNFNGLRPVDSPASAPWQVNVQIISQFGNEGRQGSGVLIDAYHVLTAGHVVHNRDLGGWATSVVVTPALSGGSTPYQTARAIGYASWTGWTDHENFDWDMAVIRLDRPVGVLTGWHGYGYNSNGDFFRTTTFRTPGYPGASPYDGNHMFYHSGTYDRVRDHVVEFDRLSIPGQSGSGSYNLATNVVYAVASHNTTNATGHTRINDTRFGAIRSYIGDFIPSSPDLSPLAVRGPASMTAGERPGSIGLVVANYSTRAFSGTVRMDVYLSRDSVIDGTDYRLGRTQAELTIPGRGGRWALLEDLPEIPWDLPEGRWNIGVIIMNDDGRNNNNAGTIDDVSPTNVVVLPPHIVRGTITHVNGSTVPGVLLTGFPSSVLTNDSGEFSAAVPHGWTGRVQPRLEGLDFDPRRLDFAPVFRDQHLEFRADVARFQVSGRVRLRSGSRLEGVAILGLPGEVVTDDRGEFNVELEYGWSGTVRPRLPLMIIEPKSLEISFLDDDHEQHFKVTPTEVDVDRVQAVLLMGTEGLDPPMSTDEQDQIDGLGNQNDVVDVGDYRAILMDIMARVARGLNPDPATNGTIAIEEATTTGGHQ